MTELWRETATEIAARVARREASATEVTIDALARLDAFNPRINAVVDACHDEALETARKLDASIARGEPVPPLGGVPVTVKVMVDQLGYANTNGLTLQKDRIAETDSPVVANLKKAGAIIIGRTNTPAFSLRWFTRNQLHGATTNPLNAALTPGGSSGGAAAATAAGIGAMGHGTDIAGSVRYPAYACGIHGLRPSLGRIANCNASGPDRYIAGQLMAVSGPLARSINDLKICLTAMAAKDARDPWWVPAPLDLPVQGKKVALCVNPDELPVAPEVETALRASAAMLQDSGWQVEEVPCPGFKRAAELNLALWMADMRRAGADLVARENDPDANTVFKGLCDLSTAPDVSGLLDIMQERVSLTRQWQLFLQQYAVVLCPVSSELPFLDHDDVSSERRFKEIVAAQVSQIGLPFTGLPGLTVSTGVVTDAAGAVIPVGVQLVADRYREDLLLMAGHDIERAGSYKPGIMN